MGRFIVIVMMILKSCTSGHGQVFQSIYNNPLAGTLSFSGRHADVFSFLVNQASLAQLKNPSVGIFSERKFLLNDLTRHLITACFSLPAGNIGLKTDYYGNKFYNEMQAGLAYAKKLGDKMDLGIQFNYNIISIGGYGKTSGITAELGTIFHFNEKIHAGFHTNNAGGSLQAKTNIQIIPVVYSMAIGFEASSKFYCALYFSKEKNRPVNTAAFFNYLLSNSVGIKGGFSTSNSNVWIGVTLRRKKIRISSYGSYHPYLGISPSLAMQLFFKDLNYENERRIVD